MLETEGDDTKQTSLDEQYAKRFWEKQPPGMKEVMMENIILGAKLAPPQIGSFVNPDGIDEQDKEKLSAYRVLAKAMGYHVGKYQFHKGYDTANTTITKVGPNKILLKETYEKCKRVGTLFLINVKLEEHEIEEVEYILKIAGEICARYQKQSPQDANLQEWLRIIAKTKETLGFYKLQELKGINAGQFAHNIKAIYDLIKAVLLQEAKQGA